MNMRKTLLIWMTSLSTTFGIAATGNTPHDPPAPEASTAELSPTQEKRIYLKKDVETQLRETARKLVISLGWRGQWKIAKQVTGLEQILYKGLPTPVWNRIATTMNDDPVARQKMINAISKVIKDGASGDSKKIQKCRDTLTQWEKDPSSFARALGDAAGTDFLQENTTYKAPAPQ